MPWLAERVRGAVVIVLLLSTDATTMIGLLQLRRAGLLRGRKRRRAHPAAAGRANNRNSVPSIRNWIPGSRTTHGRAAVVRPRWLNTAGLAGRLLLAFTLPVA